jgi:peptidoglycan/LPS O-acetylase OafA/YrhL
MQPRHIRFPELQSLRGIAALIVLLHHSSFLFTTGTAFHYWAELLLNAHAAVILFFVLSGYVLTLALSNTELKVADIAKFYVSRAFRIYPPVWAVSFLGIAYVLFVHRLPAWGATEWYTAFFFQPNSLKDFLLNFLGMRNDFIPPMWSIRIELIASAIMPFLVLAINRGFGVWLLVASIVIALYGHVWIFLPSFIVGALASRSQKLFGRYLGTVTALVVSTMVLIFFRRLDPGWRFEVDYNAVIPMLVESLAAATLIVGVVGRSVHVLRIKLATWLGDISFSVYLIHFLVMSVLARSVAHLEYGGDFRAATLMLGTLLLTLPLALLCYETIEKSGIAAGKVVSGTLQKLFFPSNLSIAEKAEGSTPVATTTITTAATPK